MENMSKKKVGMLNFLPEEITLEILSRLPVESVLEGRCVSKKWLNLLCDPSFGRIHLRRQLLQLDDDHKHAAEVKESFILLIGYREINYDENGEELYYTDIEIPSYDEQIYYSEYDGNDEWSYERLKKINHPPMSKHHNVVGSCNGLICFHVCHNYKVADPVYICNPNTREYVNLPRFTDIDNEDNIIKMVCGFGYHPSTNEYKVVRIYYYSDQLVGHVQVYTLGRVNGSKDSPGMWRNKGETSYLLRSTFPCFRYGVLANGALHWLDMENKIVAFDLADEDFHLLPSPLCFLPGDYKKYELGVFEGWLRVIQIKRDDFIDMWLFKKTSNCSTISKKEEDCGTYSWRREFTLRIKSVSVYEPIIYTKKGQILLWMGTRLIRYDPKTATMEYLVDYLEQALESFQVIRHRNSFVSLKALGEEDVKTIESAGRVF